MTDDRGGEAERPSGIARATEKATETAQKVMGWFPVRVFQRFSQRNGDILAAGASYQAFFAIAAALYVVFAVVGLWLGASSAAIDGLIDLINGYMPGLISEDGSGLAKPDAVRQIASDQAGTFTVSGIVALLAVIWTAIGWIGFVRKAVRDIFDLPPEQGNFVIMKARDLAAAIGFALLLLIGGVLSTFGSSSLNFVFDMLHWDNSFVWVLSQILSVVVAFGINAVTLLVLFRFLTGTDLKIATIWPGALIGGFGITVLQFSAGFLLGKTPNNPLLASFVVIIGLLLWFRLIMMVMLLAASWISETAHERNIAIIAPTPEERAVQQAETLYEAALVRYREARIQRAGAKWYARPSATRDLRHRADRVEQTREQLNRARIALEESGNRKVTKPDPKLANDAKQQLARAEQSR